MAPKPPRSSAAVLVLLLCLSASAAPARVSARKLLAANEQTAPSPLRVKIRGCFAEDQSLTPKIAADIAAVDAYAAANNRTRLTYNGTVSNLTAELGSFDMLIVYTYLCRKYVVFSAAEQAAVETALATGSLKKLMVWHAMSQFGINDGVPEVLSAGCINNSSNFISANPALYTSVGPKPPSSNAPLRGNSASAGACPISRVQGLNNSVPHAWDTNDASRITAFSFCYQGGPGALFYSRTPMDVYLMATYLQNAAYARLAEFNANAISVFSNDNSCSCLPTPKPVVTVSGTPATICEDASSVLLSFNATSSLGGSITIGTITGASCSVENTTVGSGAGFTVNCTKGDGWPTSPFTVSVTVTAGSADCPGSLAGFATVTVTPKPVVTVSGVPVTICEDASSVLLSFTATSNLPGAAAINTSAIILPNGVACSGPASATSGQAFTVTCPKGAGWPTPSPFNVTVAATAGSAGCAGSASGVATVTVTRPADVVLSATWLPPNNKMFDVSLASVPLQDPALPGNVTVSSVEFVDVLKGRRPTFPLAVFSPGSAVVSLRAQRNGAGSGRLYRIKYTAANAAGSCGGMAFVCVPHDASAPKATCPTASSIAEAAWMPTTAP